MTFEPIRPEHDTALAALIRRSLEARGLDIPGTAYYDEGLDHLSEYYALPGRAYYVLLEDGKLIGGIGFAAFGGFPACCEMQKLYLADEYQGRKTGYRMIAFLEQKAAEAGYRRVYLETHSNLQAAIHIYERSGYQRIDPPPSVVHSTMDRFYLKDL